MPCYTYKCPNPDCGAEFEKIVSVPDPDLKQNCSLCGAESPTITPIGKTGIAFRFNYMEP